MSKVNFQGDVLIHSTNDGGEIDIEDGLIQDCNTFSTAVYISLFGGNKDDVAGRNKETWWGNLIPGTDGSEKIVSQFQAITCGLPLTGANLKKAQTAAESDLKWFVDEGIADSVSVSLAAENIKRVRVSVEFTKDGSKIFESAYYFEWEGVQNGLR